MFDSDLEAFKIEKFCENSHIFFKISTELSCYVEKKIWKKF